MFDASKWVVLRPGVETKVESGLVHVRGAGPLWVSCIDTDGVAFVLVGEGVVKARVPECTVQLAGSKPALIFAPQVDLVDETGLEIYTNADRMPMESGTLLEVMSAVRAFKLEQRQIRNEARHELQRVRASRPVETVPHRAEPDEPQSESAE